MRFLLKLICVLLVLCTVLFAVGLRPYMVAEWVDEVLLQNDAVVAVMNLFGREGGGAAAGATGSGETVQAVRVIDEAQFSDELAEGIKNFEATITLRFEVPHADMESDAMSRYMLSQVENAFAVIRKEYPEIFWMSLGTYDLQWEQAGGDQHVTLYLQMKYCHSPDEKAEMERRIEAVVDEVVAAAPADSYGAARHFHDWIIDRTVYASEIARQDSMEGHEAAFNIDGVFLDGAAVCEGYTKAYKLLCERAGIPCVIVFGIADGENHGWNYVQLDGGWYLVDCTWDDPVGARDILLLDYFLKGSQSLVGGTRVADTYQNDGAGYPVLARQAYDADTVADLPAEQAGEIWVDASVLQIAENGPNAAPGARVAQLEAGGGSAPYRYRLTGEGEQDALFRLDESGGELTVAAESLRQGSYTVEIAVTDSRGQTAAATLRIVVDPPPEATPPENWEDGSGQGRQDWVA